MWRSAERYLGSPVTPETEERGSFLRYRYEVGMPIAEVRVVANATHIQLCLFAGFIRPAATRFCRGFKGKGEQREKRTTGAPAT